MCLSLRLTPAHSLAPSPTMRHAPTAMLQPEEINQALITHTLCLEHFLAFSAWPTCAKPLSPKKGSPLPAQAEWDPSWNPT